MKLRSFSFASTALLKSAPAIIVMLIGGHSAQAAVKTWAGTTNATWNTGTNWDLSAIPVTTDSLVFTSATGLGGLLLNNNLTSAAFSVAGITFDSGAGAYVIGNGTATANIGNTFVLTGAVLNSSTNLQTINNPFSMTAVRTFTMTAGGGNITLGGAISGTGGGITTAGTGTLTLSAANTYTTGGTTINSTGTINASVAGSLSTGAVINNGTLNLTGGAVAYTFGAVSGAGTTNITLGAAASTVSFATGTTWAGLTAGAIINVGVSQAASSGKVQIGNALPSTATVNVTTNSTLFVSTAVTHLASLVLNGGTTGEAFGQVRMEGNVIWAGPVTLAANTSIGGNANQTGFISGNIIESAGSRSLAKSGSGTIILSGTNTYTGGTTLTAGTLTAQDGATATPGANNFIKGLGTGTVTLGAGGTLNLRANGSASTQTIVTGDGTTGNNVTVSGSATIDLNRISGANTGSTIQLNNLSIGAQTLTVSGGNTYGLRFAGTTTLTGNATFNLTSAPLTLTAVSDGGSGFSFTKTGAGVLNLSTAAANTYTGATTIGTAGSTASAGTTTLSGAGSIATSSGVTINGTGSRLLLDNTLGNVDRINNTGAVNLSLGGELSLTGNATTDTSETFGSLAIGAGNQIVTIASAAGRVTTLNAGAASNAFTRTGNGTALIRGTALDQSAATTVSRFTLGDAGASLTFVGTNTLNNAATNDATQAVKIVPYLFGDATPGGNGNNFVTYDTTLGLRVLNATEGTTLDATSTTAANPVNAVVALTSIVTTPGLTVNSLLFNAASQFLDGSGALTINSGAVAAVANSTTIDSGFTSLALGNGEGVITATTGNTLTINPSISVTASGGLTKAGGGTLILGGASNSYTGTTAINQGTLSYNNAANQSFAALNGGGTVLNALNSGTLAFTQAASSTYNIGTITNSTTTGAAGAFTLNAGASSNTTIATINGAIGSIVNLGGASTGTTAITNILNAAGQTVNFNAGTVDLNGSGAFRSTMVVNGATVNTVSATGNSINFNEIRNLQVLSGTLNVRQLNGLRIGNQFGTASASGAIDATALQSGGTINFTNSASFSLGHNATTGSFLNTFALSAGLFDSSTSTGTISVGAGVGVAGAGGTSSFNFSGGTLLWRGTISGSQGAGAQQSFVWTGGTLAVGTYTATNLTSTQGTAVVIGTTNTLTNAGGILAPGGVGTGGRTAITGNYNVTSASASYAVDIGSATTATAFQSGAAFYDNTIATGTVVLGGTLNVSLINGFTPAAQTFTILTGTSFTGSFSNVSGGKVTLAGGATFDVTVGATTVTLSNYTPGAAGYSSWQTANGTAQTIDLDHDSDGVSNGVEYFIGGNSITTGFTALPAIVTVGSVHSVTFTRAAGYTGVYGTDYTIETSASLAAGSWATEASGVNVTFPTSTTVKYTFPAGVTNFARLKVTGP